MISRHALAAALSLGVSIGPACANRDVFVVDLVNNPASLDPQLQWDPDSKAEALAAMPCIENAR
jgi:hypothetical protein